MPWPFRASLSSRKWISYNTVSACYSCLAGCLGALLLAADNIVLEFFTLHQVFAWTLLSSQTWLWENTCLEAWPTSNFLSLRPFRGDDIVPQHYIPATSATVTSPESLAERLLCDQLSTYLVEHPRGSQEGPSLPRAPLGKLITSLGPEAVAGKST